MKELEGSIVFFSENGEILWGLASSPYNANDTSYLFTVAYISPKTGNIVTGIYHEDVLFTSLLKLIISLWSNAFSNYVKYHKYIILEKMRAKLEEKCEQT